MKVWPNKLSARLALTGLLRGFMVASGKACRMLIFAMLCLSFVIPSAWGVAAGYSSFLAAVALRESGGRMNAVNPYGYLGLYQMGEAALVDAGFVKRDANPNNNDFSGGWTGKNGITSQAGFLANRAAQDTAIEAFHRGTWNTITNLGLDKYVGQTIGGVLITASGLLGGAHLVGAGKVRDFLRSGGAVIPKDANGTSVTEYLSRFGGFDISSITGKVEPNAGTGPGTGGQGGGSNNPPAGGAPSAELGEGASGIAQMAGLAFIAVIAIGLMYFIGLGPIVYYGVKMLFPRRP